MSNELREQLADLEHQQWAHWTDYLFRRLSLSPNSLKVDEETKKDFERWVKQIITPYKDLSKKEKDADREWADKVLKLIKKRDQEVVEIIESCLLYRNTFIRKTELVNKLEVAFPEK